jgi:methionine-rich copper-binding protein CopC
LIARLGGLVAALLTLAVAGDVESHSLLLQSVPAAGVTLTASPSELMLRFNNRIEKSLSRVRLVDEHGAPRPLTVTVDAGPADRLTAAIPGLAPGRWRVEWQVLSTDGHVVSGRFDFTVAP